MATKVKVTTADDEVYSMGKEVILDIHLCVDLCIFVQSLKVSVKCIS